MLIEKDPHSLELVVIVGVRSLIMGVGFDLGHVSATEQLWATSMSVERVRRKGESIRCRGFDRENHGEAIRGGQKGPIYAYTTGQGQTATHE